MPSPILPPGVVYHPAQIKAYDVEVHGFNGDKVPAYVARPSEEGIFPGLVLVHGVHGYEEHMKDVARRFAAVGYAAIVPALYSRNDRLCVVEESDMANAREWLGNRPNAQANADLEGGKSFLQSSGFVSRPGQRRPRGREEFPPVQWLRKSADWARWVLLGRKGGPGVRLQHDRIGRLRQLLLQWTLPVHPSQSHRPCGDGQRPLLPDAGTVWQRRHQPLAGRRGTAGSRAIQAREGVRDGGSQGGGSRFLFRHPRELPS